MFYGRALYFISVHRATRGRWREQLLHVGNGSAQGCDGSSEAAGVQRWALQIAVVL